MLLSDDELKLIRETFTALPLPAEGVNKPAILIGDWAKLVAVNLSNILQIYQNSNLSK